MTQICCSFLIPLSKKVSQVDIKLWSLLILWCSIMFLELFTLQLWFQNTAINPIISKLYLAVFIFILAKSTCFSICKYFWSSRRNHFIGFYFLLMIIQEKFKTEMQGAKPSILQQKFNSQQEESVFFLFVCFFIQNTWDRTEVKSYFILTIICKFQFVYITSSKLVPDILTFDENTGISL